MPQINAFRDNGYASGRDFCSFLLRSPEFSYECLRQIVAEYPNLRAATKDLKTKDSVASELSAFLERDLVSAEAILLKYVQQPRSWLSFKIGSYQNLPILGTPHLLLTDFCQDSWHGPISDSSSSKAWYLRTQSIDSPTVGESNSGNQIIMKRIRWTVIAELSDRYIALTWNNFTHKKIVDDHLGASAQFPFWKYISAFTDELISQINGQYEYLNLHKLVLLNLWDRYLSGSQANGYVWKHLRIRAEAAGVAVNAHSAGISDIDVRGIQALSNQLAMAAMRALGFSEDSGNLADVEVAILRTLIHEWGAKSYEFSLEGKKSDEPNDFPESDISESFEGEKINKIFRAHCYFGLKPESKSQDSLQHLRTYLAYGGTRQTIDFLLNSFDDINQPAGPQLDLLDGSG
ncbi:MAG: hypothetical protein AAGF66_08250 [Cyanobacteria bacterium P01_H01_bin.119]